jgi:hypothetical protein
MRTMWVPVAVALSVSAGLASPAAGQEAAPGAGATLRPFDSTARVVTESMRRDLARVRAAQTTYYAANGRYAASSADLELAMVDGTEITIEDADDRSYRAVATNVRVPGAQLELVTLAPPPGMTPAPASGRVAGDDAGAAVDSSGAEH